MPIAYTFILGLVLDMLADLPVGLSALVLVGLQTVVQKSRLFLMGQPYIVVWLGFAIMALANAISLWFLLSLAAFDFAPLGAFVQTLVATLFSILIFPFVSLLLQGIHRLLPVTSPMRMAR